MTKLKPEKEKQSMDSQFQQQQQWAAMSAQPQHHQHHIQQQQPQVWGVGGAPSQQYHQPTTLEEIRTLWIGDLQYWVDENYLNTCFAHSGEVSLSLTFFLEVLFTFRVSAVLKIMFSYAKVVFF